MSDKYLKEIANGLKVSNKELRLIRIALQGNNQSVDEGVQKEFIGVHNTIPNGPIADELGTRAGEVVTIK